MNATKFNRLFKYECSFKLDEVCIAPKRKEHVLYILLTETRCDP